MSRPRKRAAPFWSDPVQTLTPIDTVKWRTTTLYRWLDPKFRNVLESNSFCTDTIQHSDLVFVVYDQRTELIVALATVWICADEGVLHVRSLCAYHKGAYLMRYLEYWVRELSPHPLHAIQLHATLEACLFYVRLGYQHLPLNQMPDEPLKRDELCVHLQLLDREHVEQVPEAISHLEEFLLDFMSTRSPEQTMKLREWTEWSALLAKHNYMSDQEIVPLIKWIDADDDRSSQQGLDVVRRRRRRES